VSGASRTLDPIEAAEARIAGSKRLIASVANDLSQHQRWLAHYRAAERRHARRVMLQELIYQIELGRRSLMRLSKRLALISFRLARSIAAFLSRTAAAVLAVLRRIIMACAIWIRPRAYALALTLQRWLLAFSIGVLDALIIALAWLAVHSRALAITLRKWLSTSWSWTRLKAGILKQASLKGASVGSAWIAVKSRASALALQNWLSAGAAWTSAKAEALARTSVATASAGFSWAVVNVRRISLAYSRAGRKDAGHRALVVRQCTALVCIEPQRTAIIALQNDCGDASFVANRQKTRKKKKKKKPGAA
jgi:hypothetical protein